MRAGLRLHQRDEFRDVPRPQLRPDHQHRRHARDRRQRRHLHPRVETHRQQRRVDGMGRLAEVQQGQPIRAGAGDDLGPDDPAGARPVLHRDRLAEHRAEFLRCQPGGDVGGPAGGEGHHHAQRAIRPIALRLGSAARKRGSGQAQQATARQGHAGFPVEPARPCQRRARPIARTAYSSGRGTRRSRLNPARATPCGSGSAPRRSSRRAGYRGRSLPSRSVRPSPSA